MLTPDGKFESLEECYSQGGQGDERCQEMCIRDRHKILAIAEEEGAQSASYALKLLQSEGELNIASTGKNPVTGRLVTHPYSCLLYTSRCV